jgi:hypothetical protein
VPRLAAALTVLVLLGAAACAGNQAGESDPGEPARIEVENRSSFDMDIYVRTDRGGASRLGLAPASETTAFPLVASRLAGAGAVRFEGRPVRGQSSPVLSEPYKVRAGELISWSIPPQ